MGPAQSARSAPSLAWLPSDFCPVIPLSWWNPLPTNSVKKAEKLLGLQKEKVENSRQRSGWGCKTGLLYIFSFVLKPRVWSPPHTHTPFFFFFFIRPDLVLITACSYLSTSNTYTTFRLCVRFEQYRHCSRLVVNVFGGQTLHIAGSGHLQGQKPERALLCPSPGVGNPVDGFLCSSWNLRKNILYLKHLTLQLPVPGLCGLTGQG